MLGFSRVQVQISFTLHKRLFSYRDRIRTNHLVLRIRKRRNAQ